MSRLRARGFTNAGDLIAAIRTLPNPYQPSIQSQAAAPAPRPVQQQNNLSQFLGANSTSGVLGANAYQRALQSGLTPQQIQSQAAAQGLSLGQGVQQQFNQPATARVDLSQFLGANSSAGTLGASAYQRALDFGLTPQQIANAASRQGLSIGSGAQQQIMSQQMEAQQPTRRFDRNASLGQNLRAAGNTLSERELNRLARITGKTKDQILKKAVERGLSIGSKVVNQYQSDSKFFPESVSVTKNGITRTFDPFRGDPILAAIRDAQRDRLNPGTRLFIGTQGGVGTVLPRNQTVSGGGGGGGRVAQPVPAVVPQPTFTQQPTIPQQAAPDLGIQNFLDQLINTAPLEQPSLPTFDQFEPLNSDFDIPDPLQFASLGQSYLTDAILAARRRQQSRRDYMRNMMMMAGMMPDMSRLAIGGGVNVS